MQPHPDFATTTLPRNADLGLLRLTPLDPSAAEEDFAVVARSEPVLRGFFGNDWPLGLTLVENRIDMAWHEREFTLRRSFSWILRDPAGVYLGCAYVFPEPGETARGKIYLWLADIPERRALLATFQPVLQHWLSQWLPPRALYDWHVNDRASGVVMDAP